MSFIGSKGAFVSSFNTTERFHLDRFLELGRSIPMIVGEQPVEVRALRNVEPRWAHGVNKSSPVTISG